MSTESHPPYRTITPSLNFKNTREAIEFYSKVFGAKQLKLIKAPDGGVVHAEVQFGDCIVMMSDANAEWNAPSPMDCGGSPTLLSFQSEDCDTLFNQAVEAGSEILMPMEDTFWGERMGMVKDPFGYRWSLGKHIEDVTPEEVEKRMKELFGQGDSPSTPAST
ncbi:MAG: VOC family protein [Opitutales bacterium]